MVGSLLNSVTNKSRFLGDIIKENPSLSLVTAIIITKDNDFSKEKMIRIIAGGKKSLGWVREASLEYERRLRKPFEVIWEIYEEEKLAKILEEWKFTGRELVIVADERGENISSVEFAERLEKGFYQGREIVIIIGGAYGVTAAVRSKADMVWSFSKLVFPHLLMRVMVLEQIYRAQEIVRGGKYHHE